MVCFFPPRRRLKRRAARRTKGQAVRPQCDSGYVLLTCCRATAHSDVLRPPIGPKVPLRAPERDHDPSRVSGGRGKGGFFRRAWPGHGGLPGISASLPLLLTAGLPGAATHAINLASVTPPADKNLPTTADTQEHWAARCIITRRRKCSSPPTAALRASFANIETPTRSSLIWPDGILTTTGFRGCPHRTIV